MNSENCSNKSLVTESCRGALRSGVVNSDTENRSTKSLDTDSCRGVDWSGTIDIVSPEEHSASATNTSMSSILSDQFNMMYGSPGSGDSHLHVPDTSFSSGASFDPCFTYSGSGISYSGKSTKDSRPNLCYIF